MTNLDRKKSFLEKCGLKFGDRFNYEKFIYVDAKTKGTIICPIHKDFQQTPDKHLQSKYGCYKCAKIAVGVKKKNIPPKAKRESITKEQYQKRFEKKHGKKFDLDFSNYLGWTMGKVILNCKKHGNSSYVPQALLSSRYACKYCAIEQRALNKTGSYHELIEEANVVHNNKYSYPSSNEKTYKNKRSEILIECQTHGLFKKRALKHVCGQGCFQCRIENLVSTGRLPGGYTEKIFNRNPKLKAKDGVVYYLKVGNLYKIGITTNLNSRIRAIRSMSKEEVTLIKKLDGTLYDSYRIESKILEEFEQYRVKEEWSSELFEVDILLGKDLFLYKD
ncbi:GIY-YIG nuclease family protein [Rossellomorea marisflavi]|uniref:GIY-YIG nuclease family protein n=1 Tax=Rossellomorea marisflavi TaxID=189381 RepID=UPI003FA05C5C